MLCLFWQYWYIFASTPIVHSFFHSLNSCSRCCFNSANRFPNPLLQRQQVKSRFRYPSFVGFRRTSSSASGKSSIGTKNGVEKLL